jgi:ATP-dependent DNA helicase RecG
MNGAVEEPWAGRDVQFLKGAGPRRAELLQKLGIRTIGELLLHLPSAYLDRTRITPLGTVRPDEVVTVAANVQRVDVRRGRGGRRDAVAVLDDGTGRIEAVWYNQPYVAGLLSPGTRLLASGRARVGRGLVLASPEFEILDGGGDRPILTGGRIVPVYPLTAGISQKLLRSLVYGALESMPQEIDDPLPPSLASSVDLTPRRAAYWALHLPETVEEAEQARRRFALEELLMFQLLLLRLRQRHSRAEDGRSLLGHPGRLARVRSHLGYTLTTAQEKALEAVIGDLRTARPAMRLLQGDVGSGKTVVAALACAWAASAGSQACFMAPTEVLALQHAETLRQLLAPADVRVDVLIGRTPAAERRRIMAELETGSIDLLVGTHALIEEKVQPRSLGLIVVDEQHRFGVMQRLRLREKGPRPHTLVMSATPIPRTLALAYYGDLDITTIDEMPPGRTPIVTRLIQRSRWDEMVGFIAGRLREGQQAFFVYPLVEESESLDLRDATRMRSEIAAHPAFDGLEVGLLTGRTEPAERERVMAALRAGTLRALVSTTVIEVGIDLPRATVLVVEHPERFGLSQLHQLRGRIGRAPGEVPYCFLMRPERTTGETAERLRVLVRESNGFRIAEEDLRLRGPGELFGTQQAGMPRMHVADLTRDGDLLRAARAAAEEILQEDPDLRRPDHARLWRTIEQRHPDGVRLFEMA